MSALESIFSWVLTTSWQASVLALLVLVAQATLGRRLNPRWRYALWLLVLLRLVLPALPESDFSLFRFAPTAPLNLPETLPTPLMGLQVSTTAPPVGHEIVGPETNDTFLFLALIWLTGALGLLVLTWLVNRRFARHVANSPAISDPQILQSFADAKAELGIRRAIRLIENSQVQSPAIMGLFHPTLLLPTNVREKFDARELRFIFLHELAHLKRGDVFVQALIALLQVLHWFNPVLWFAFRRMRIDREPATDALVLSRTGESEKERYGLMLIKLLEHFNQRHSLPTLVGILEDKDQFKRRFTLIARFTRGAYGWSMLGVLLIGVLAVACLTKSKATEPATQGAIIAYPVKKDIVATTFWNAKIPGPFYAALPFNDVADPDAAKQWVPPAWTKAAASGQRPRSACLGRWVKITNQAGASCYVPWEDFGPGTEDDPEYVFGSKPPKNGQGGGIDLSPGAAKFLGLDDKHQTVSWQFVDEKDVPPGPWLPPPPSRPAPDSDPQLPAASPATASVAPLSVRTFAVPAGFFKAATADYNNVQAELIARGISFPASAAAIFVPKFHKIVVRDTPEQLDKIQALFRPAPTASSEQIQLDLKVLEIPDTVYAANKTRIDAAVDRADIWQFNNMEGVSLLSTPSVTTQAGLRANIDIVREFPYPTGFESRQIFFPLDPVCPGREGRPMAPSSFRPLPANLRPRMSGSARKSRPPSRTETRPTPEKSFSTEKSP